MSPAPAEVTADWPGIRSLVNGAPIAAVTMAWTKVEPALRELARAYGVPEADKNWLTTSQLVQAYLVLPPSIVEAVQQLSTLRNNVAHLGASPDPTEAAEYVESAATLYDYLIIQSRPDAIPRRE